MFGQDDMQQQPGQDNAMQAAMPDPISSNTFGPPNQDMSLPTPTDPSVFGAPPTAPSAPAMPADPAPFAPAPDLSMPEIAAPAAVSEETTVPVQTAVNSGDLLGLKQQALQHLSPLVDHLDQTPEEKFRTTMMMIQASDDQSLIKTAFEAAQKITDDKARAQALLDVINEINYFTQHQSPQA